MKDLLFYLLAVSILFSFSACEKESSQAAPTLSTQEQAASLLASVVSEIEQQGGQSLELNGQYEATDAPLDAGDDLEKSTNASSESLQCFLIRNYGDVNRTGAITVLDFVDIRKILDRCQVDAINVFDLDELTPCLPSIDFSNVENIQFLALLSYPNDLDMIDRVDYEIFRSYFGGGLCQ